MKYASQVIDLLSAHPEREFKMGEIVGAAVPPDVLTPKTRLTVRIGIHRVLEYLAEMGSVAVHRGPRNRYQWLHE